MLSKKTVFIAIIVVSLIIIFVTVRNGLLLQKEGLHINLKIGKELYIIVVDSDTINAEYLSEVANGTRDSTFELWDNKELRKLILYLKENDFIIEQGKYTINQAWSFEKVREVLRFRKR